MSTQKELLDCCQEIGGIAGCNCHYTDGLARRIEATGKLVKDLTVGELLAIAREHTDFYNRVHDVKER